jgi:hypothetical protein
MLNYVLMACVDSCLRPLRISPLVPLDHRLLVLLQLQPLPLRLLLLLQMQLQLTCYEFRGSEVEHQFGLGYFFWGRKEVWRC